VLENLLKVWESENAQRSQQNLFQGMSDMRQRLNDHVMNQHQHNNHVDGVMVDIRDSTESNGRRLNDFVMNQNQHNHAMGGFMSHIINTTESTNQLLVGRMDGYHLLIEQYERLVLDSSSRAEEAEKLRRKNHQEEVLAWLGSEIQQSAYHRNFLKVSRKVPRIVRNPGAEGIPDSELEPGTAVWILNEAKIDNWMNEACPSYPVVWLRGKKGAGNAKPDLFSSHS